MRMITAVRTITSTRQTMTLGHVRSIHSQRSQRRRYGRIFVHMSTHIKINKIMTNKELLEIEYSEKLGEMNRKHKEELDRLQRRQLREMEELMRKYMQLINTSQS